MKPSIPVLLAAFAMVPGCATTSTILERAGTVEKVTTSQHEPMVNCAPVELARAEAYKDFAVHESSQGRSHTATEFIELAEANAKAAYRKSRGNECKGDRDADGIPDVDDQCVDTPEDMDRFQDEDGCPDPDNDLDGVPDVSDRCPNRKGPAVNDGCPVKDSDGDGLADTEDRCPTEFGPKLNGGCPIKDSDRDGVPDGEDACPADPGPKDNDGCPYKLIQVTNERIVLKEKIFFASGKARIKRASYPLLNEIVEALKAHPTYVVRIEGHTDSVGSAASNMRLSRARANAVRRYLMSRGIEPARLKAVGYGEERPIDDNSTEEGRAVNRRVEFHIISK